MLAVVAVLILQFLRKLTLFLLIHQIRPFLFIYAFGSLAAPQAAFLRQPLEATY